MDSLEAIIRLVGILRPALYELSLDERPAEQRRQTFVDMIAELDRLRQTLEQQNAVDSIPR